MRATSVMLMLSHFCMNTTLKMLMRPRCMRSHCSGSNSTRDPATYMRAAAVLEDYFPANQQHPGVVHYLIHSYDDPVHAPLGMRAARLYRKLAPDSGHALHMTSHIFIAMGMWRDVIQANLEALASSTRQSKSGADVAASCNHGNSWLSYGYLQVGDFQRAHEVVASCLQKTLALPLDKGSYGYAQQMMAHYLVETQQWTDPLLAQPAPPAQFLHALVTFWYSHAMAAAQRGDLAEAQRDFDYLTSATALVASLAKDSPAAESDAAIEEQQVKAMLLLGHGDKAQALEILQEAAKKERGIPFEFGPPPVPKPSAELVAELLIKLNRPAEAIQALRDQLTRTPGKTATLSDLRDAAKLANDFAAQKAAEEVLATNLAKTVPTEAAAKNK